ncbi:lipid A-modifier LpxR family protein [Rubellimicrobium sp. CFH 75288]|uniref:lipid A-modifier LpxR family protein n=1 Tax=Rubellimicrobium sp. CFH 75288 TaxID=2697034 RepID=UPI0014127AB4|nr:lipid A-modifier LpxR family protein [Rubellimicrobium sp. CFH 75288]NAZ35432.1 DUF2219 family protein [Rubellimicrobium sp. CFH 75288]
MRIMWLWLCVFLATVTLAAPAPAQTWADRTTLGIGRLFSNDFFGDGGDRWRTGSYAVSVMRGDGWDGSPPGWGEGPLLEWRFRSEIIAPRSLSGPRADDRPYAASFAFGLHSHWSLGPGEVAAGADLVTTGPQTGLGRLMANLHERFDLPRIDDSVLRSQIGDGVHPHVSVAYAQPVRIASSVTLRPFAEAQAGVEDLARLGADVIVGGAVDGSLWLRDIPSGQLYRGIEGPGRGAALTFGADWASVGGSIWLPESRGILAEPERWRARAGVHWQVAPDTSFFYGLSWLSPEVVGQGAGQLTGQLKLNFNF